MGSKIDTSAFHKFKILLYKDFLLRKRHFILTALEIIFAVFIASIPIIIQSELSLLYTHNRQNWINDTSYLPFNSLSKNLKYNNYFRENFVLFAYAPSNNYTNKLMEDAIQLWKNNNIREIAISKGLKDGDELENYCVHHQQLKNYSLAVIGTVFNNIDLDQKRLPSDLDYTIRHSPKWPGFSTDLKYTYSDYYKRDVYARSTFFLSWQAAVEKTFIQKTMIEENKTLDYELWMQEFPSPGHFNRTPDISFSSLIPIVITVALIGFSVNLMRRVIEEKSNGSKELMKVMGMTDFTYWTSTFLSYYIMGAIIFLAIAIMYKSPLKGSTVLLEHSNFMLLYFVFLLFLASFILFCLAWTTFFNKVAFGIILMIVVYIISFSLLHVFLFPAIEMEVVYFPLSLFAKFCICLLPPGALLSFSYMILAYESSGEGIQWSNLYNTDAIPGFNLSGIMIAMIFSCLLYAVIIWYIDAVWPSQYGVPKPFYFPFTKSYWCGYQDTKENGILLDPVNETKNNEFFEDDPTGVSPGVVIRNLSKVFRDGFETKVAANNISLNIYNGQITALLGHNGAGKTTIINMLTGLYLPSSGTAQINNWDIFSQTTKARQFLGVCPQNDVLYDTLTVEEHLKIYAALKGVSWSQLDQETNAVLAMLHLIDKKSEIAKNLPAGTKRALSLGIAVIGGSKVLFLDEPTSGMDVEVRRKVWDVLLDLRQNHTIILTTHYMEEADFLGDRIAIMAYGEIQCCGSPLFLKKKFGTGCHLRLVKRMNFDLGAVKDVLTLFIPGATLENEYEGEVTFNLMSNENSAFGSLLETIELNKDVLGINSCGITVTSMEDVFLHVATLADVKSNLEVDISLDDSDEETMKDVYIESNQFGKAQKFHNQLFALILKRLHYSKRHWNIVVAQLVLPFIIMCICLSVINSTSYSFTSEPLLKLDIEQVYGKTDGFYHSDTDPFSKSLETEIQRVLYEKNVDAKFVDDPHNFILNYGRESISHYYKHLLVGGSVETSGNKLNVTAWFNGFPNHALPMSLLLMDTAILRKVSKSGYITLTNHPLPAIDNVFRYEHIMEQIMAFVFVPLALSFLSASFVLVPIQERASKAKLLQMMTGISPVTYWLSMFVWDFIANTIVSILLMIPFAIFCHQVFFSNHSEAIGSVLLMMVLYGWSTIPFSYLFSLMFNKLNTGFSVVTVVCVITGGAFALTFTFVTNHLMNENSSVKFFYWVLKLLPSYALTSGFGNLFYISFNNAYCETLSPIYLKYKCAENPIHYSVLPCCKGKCGDKCLEQIHPITMDIEGCGRDILFLTIDGIIYFLLLVFLESSFVKLLFYRGYQHLLKFRDVPKNDFDDSFIGDSDVLQEEEKVKNNFDQTSQVNALIALNLTKVFKNVKAVDHLTFSIPEKECFGLLGVNGAGKTTTFRILTGDCYPTEGNAYIGNFSVTNDLKKFQSYLGYCPQFDALIDKLSAREMLTLFARLRGLSETSMTAYVNALIKMADLTQYADKPVEVYSKGNKRKLSVALSLVGAPRLLLLDEPTAGVDPVSRRKIWKIMSFARVYCGSAIILSTHSMEESEAVCSRLAIMVNGRFQCLGSIQHLKSKHGSGYTLILKLKKEDQNIIQSVNAVKAYIDVNLPGAQLKDDHQGVLQYHVIDTSVTLSHLFRFMNDMKESFNLEDYIVSDTSLEQIFLTFIRSQRIVGL